jgi:hypothetical protein
MFPMTSACADPISASHVQCTALGANNGDAVRNQNADVDNVNIG